MMTTQQPKTTIERTSKTIKGWMLAFCALLALGFILAIAGTWVAAVPLLIGGVGLIGTTAAGWWQHG